CYVLLMESIDPNDYERPNTIQGLLAKRKQLTKLLNDLRSEQRKVVSDIDHIDGAIRLFDPEADGVRLARYPTKYRAKKGEVVRLVVRMLK
ncbi:hypothetical protein, partial [Klebsiella pneumoniae]|uniref:hypothetical protein n=1 Tax=Klebsiella pneumoniae TaxID=573 RepID=UPI002731A208